LFGWEGKTSGIKNLLFDSFVKNYRVCLPTEALAKKFSLIIAAIQQKKQKNLKENVELEALRDWLLPMLMNGQVTVKDVNG
jgi:type I restriction enzyme S subunit